MQDRESGPGLRKKWLWAPGMGRRAGAQGEEAGHWWEVQDTGHRRVQAERTAWHERRRVWVARPGGRLLGLEAEERAWASAGRRTVLK